MARERTKAGELLAILDDGEGRIELSREFRALDALTRADILLDWLDCVLTMYNGAVRDMAADFKKRRKARPVKGKR